MKIFYSTNVEIDLYDLTFCGIRSRKFVQKSKTIETCKDITNPLCLTRCRNCYNYKSYRKENGKHLRSDHINTSKWFQTLHLEIYHLNLTMSKSISLCSQRNVRTLTRFQELKEYNNNNNQKNLF